MFIPVLVYVITVMIMVPMVDYPDVPNGVTGMWVGHLTDPISDAESKSA